ncbi:4072_t:CDS:2, partial [Gigaspora rosea]
VVEEFLRGSLRLRAIVEEIVRMSVTDTQSRIDFSSERISKLNADDDDLLARIQKLEDADNDLKIAMEILNEGPIIKYRPPFLNGLEFDLEDIVNRDRLKRCMCQDNRIFLFEVWYDEKPEIVIPERYKKSSASVNFNQYKYEGPEAFAK